MSSQGVWERTAPRGPVLIVEDHDEVRAALVAFLEAAGYRTVSAENGLRALDVLTHAPERPCLILLDLMMPVMDGVGFRLEQLQRPALADVPVIVVSGYAQVSRAQALHPVAYVPKPIASHDLLRYVRQACGC